MISMGTGLNPVKHTHTLSSITVSPSFPETLKIMEYLFLIPVVQKCNCPIAVRQMIPFFPKQNIC